MKFKIKLLTGAVALVTAGSACATNGYFLPGFGLRSQGMGGVGIAYGRDSLSTAANPANAVNTGMRGDIGFSIFNPERSSAVGAATGLPGGDSAPGGGSFFGFNGNFESELAYFVVPEMGFSMPLTEKLHLAVAVVGNGGMNTNYNGNFFSFGGAPDPNSSIGVDLIQLLVPISLGYKINDDHALGVSLVLASQRFRSYGLEAFANFPGVSSNPAFVTGNGYDYSYGAGVKLGWLGEFMDDKLTLGLAYASRTYMTKWDKYKGLFAEGGDFDIPESYGIGIAIKPKKNLVIAADILRINYNDIASVGNPGPGVNPGPPDPTLGTGAIPSQAPGGGRFALGLPDGMGFGWENQTVYKLGIQYGVNNRLQLRAGYNYGSSPITDDPVFGGENALTFNVLAPATVERHYSVGFTYRASDTLEVSGTYMYVANNSQGGCNLNIVDCVTFNMHQNVFGVSLGWVLEEGINDYGDLEVDPYDFSGFYFGMGFGQSNHVDANASVAESELTTAGAVFNTTAVNKRSEGWKVFAGYQFTPLLGLEGGYVNLNDSTATTLVTAPANAVGRINTDTAVDSWFLGVTGTLAVTENIDLFGKVGAHHWSSDFQVSNTDNLAPSAVADRLSSDDGVDVYYGLGASYTLIEGLDLRAEWERFKVDNDDVDLVSAGFAVRF